MKLYVLLNKRGFYMQKRSFEQKDKKYAPPLRSEKKIGNTTFIVNSFFPEQAKDGVSSKIERLIKDEIQNTATTI